MTRQRIHPDLKPGHILHVFTKNELAYYNRLREEDRPDGSTYLQAESSSFAISIESVDAHHHDLVSVPSHLMLVLASRRERTADTRLPHSFRKLLHPLGIFPVKTVFSKSSFFFVEDGPHLQYYKDRFPTGDQLLSAEYSNERLSHSGFLSSWKDASTWGATKIPVIRNDRIDHLRDINPLLEAKTFPGLTLFFQPVDIYKNLRVLDYEPSSFTPKPHPVSLSVQKSLSPEDQADLLHPFGRSSILILKSRFFAPFILVNKNEHRPTGFSSPQPLQMKKSLVFDNDYFSLGDVPYLLLFTPEGNIYMNGIMRDHGRYHTSLPLPFNLSLPARSTNVSPSIFL